MKNNLEETMTEPTKEQVEKWEIESDTLLNYFGHDDWGSVFFSKKEAFKIGYLKAKKSDFEEIKTLKERLAEAVQLLRRIKNACSPSDIITCEQELEKFLRQRK